MRRLWGALALLLALAPLSEARMHAPYRGHRIVPAAAAPLDSFTQPSGAYSFRKLRSAYTGPAIRIRRASDNAELDINFLGFVPGLGSPPDVAAAAAHCAATSCFVRTVYDQSGNARDLVQTTAGLQPPLVFDCIGTQPCIQTSATGHALLTAGSVTPATGILSLNVVANRAVGTTGCVLIRQNGTGASSRILGGVANSWNLAASAVIGAFGVADAAWHSAIGILNGASSRMIVDGVSTAGTATGSVTPGTSGMVGLTGVTCNEVEVVIWDDYILTAGEQAALTANQRSFFGF